MSASKALILFFSTVLGLLIVLSALNYAIDAQCYYRCPEITLDKTTTNLYYRSAQRVLAYPNTQVLILGSSRGEALVPQIVENLIGLPTLNLSVVGADLTSKTAFLNFALQKTPIKKVIWFTDFFEFIKKNQDSKMRKTPSLRKLLPSESNESALLNLWETLQGLLDHNTADATLYKLKKPLSKTLSRGGIDNFSAADCENVNFLGSETVQSLKTKTDIIYQNYVNGVITAEQTPESLDSFKNLLSQLTAQSIEVIVVINPYHPAFDQRLRTEFPKIYQRHLDWYKYLHSLESSHVEILDFSHGIDGTEATPQYWNDGVHFSCHSAYKMLMTSKLLKKAL